MRVSITILAFFSISSLIGQTHVGLLIGLNNTNTTSTQIFENSAARNGIEVGFVFEHTVNELIGFETGLRYSQRGFREEVRFTDAEGHPITPGESTFDYDYLTLPVLARISKGNRLKACFKAGLATSILLEAELTTSASNEFTGRSFDHTDRVTQIDLSGIIGVEASYEINPYFITCVSWNYSHGLNPFTNDEYFKDENARHFGTAFHLGLKYLISKGKRP